MSSYDSAPSTGTRPRAATTARRGTLTVAAALGGVGALGGVVWAVLLLVQGKDLIRPVAESFAQQNAGDELSSGLVNMDDIVDRAYQTFQARAEIWLVIGVLAAVAAGLLLTARNWVRIVLTLLALAAAGLAVRDLTDIGPMVLKTLDVVVILGLLAALVGQWLPASNAIVRARRTAR